LGNFKVQDHFFKKAKKENFFARSIYKLEEIDQKFDIIRTGNQVVDLGYHPGSWIQYTSKKVGENGHVTGIDIREVNHKLLNVKNVKLYKKDVFDLETYSDLECDGLFDVVLSDMAPNTTGIRSVDQDRSLNLIEKVFELLPTILKPNGHLVIKVFDSHNAQVYLKAQKNLFQHFEFLKPKSTRSVSKEFFVIGKNYKA
jgi:23S rRNA (uridine2552-2'-O)-methyltransferase